MTKVVFISHAGDTHEVDAEAGTSIMRAAVNNGIDGIVAECGGSCSCATCHCYIDEAWLERVEAPSQIEKDMLECVLEPKPNSRLSCQVTLTDAMDGIVVHLPENQY